MERVIELRGTHREMGRQLGEAFRPMISASVDHVLSELGDKMSPAEARRKATHYLPFVEDEAPYLIDEIRGVSEGSGMSLEDILLLQLRFEVVGYEGGVEGCSSLVLRNGRNRVTGQNVDTVDFHVAAGVVVKMMPNEGPGFTMYTYYPGLLGYIGMNEWGMTVFGNAVLAGDWRVGYPRYFLFRLALEQRTVAAAEEKIRRLHRASCINMLLTDDAGDVADLEVTARHVATIRPEGSFFHSNHFISDELRDQEKLLPLIPDSRSRLRRGNELVQAVDRDGRDDLLDAAKAILRDHHNPPSSICRHKAEKSAYGTDQWISVASVIAEPAERRLHVAFGNPCENDYRIVDVDRSFALAS